MNTALKLTSRSGNETSKPRQTARKVQSGKPTYASGDGPKFSRAAAIFALAAAGFHCGDAGAVGFRLPNQDPEGIARGNAFAATADNPSAIYYNPAGITQLEGQNLSVGLYLISSGVNFEGNTGGTAETKRNFQPVPQLYYTISPTNMPLSFGVGVYVPYGLSIDYGPNSVFRNDVQNGSLTYATVNPVMAWKITPELSIAAGPTINYSKADVKSGVLFPGDQFHLVGDAFAFGFTAGVFWHPQKMVAFGLNYHSATTMNYGGHSTVSGTSSTFPLIGMPGFDGSNPASASIRFPQNVVGGISFRPTDKWNLEFDLDWTDWDYVKQISVQGNLGASGLPVPAFPLNYRSTFMYEFGVTRQLPKGYFLSAGYIYSENSSPDANFTPLIPDCNLSLYSVGFGHKGEHWGWAFSYTLAIDPSRTVAGSSYDKQGALPSTTVNGTYRTLNNALNFAASFKF